MDKDLVVFRDTNGVTRALLDRCCHRGYKLSCGKVVNNNVQCGYHGWQFNGEGQCAHIPSLRENAPIPKVYSIPSFSCVEKDGYIWIWMTQDNHRPTTEPGIPEFQSGEWVQGSLPMQCEALKAIEINLDGAHVYFVHPTHPATIEFKKRGEVFSEKDNEVRLTDNGFVYFWPPTNSAADPIPRETAKIYFELPNQVRLETTFGGKTYFIILYMVPTGERSCRLEYMMSQFQPDGTKVKWLNEVPDIFAEDKRVLEIIQSTSDQFGSDYERSVEADTVTLLTRRLYKALEKEPWQQVRAKFDARKVFTTRM